MRRIKSVLMVAAVMAMMAISALPATAQSPDPICQLFLTNGELGYFPNSNSGGPGYYDDVYGWYMWCQSPVYGWYVQN